MKNWRTILLDQLQGERHAYFPKLSVISQNNKNKNMIMMIIRVLMKKMRMMMTKITMMRMKMKNKTTGEQIIKREIKKKNTLIWNLVI